jgi:hypothetical protein
MSYSLYIARRYNDHPIQTEHYNHIHTSLAVGTARTGAYLAFVPHRLICKPPGKMAATQKNVEAIERARLLRNVPWCEDYEAMASGMA